MKLDKNHFTDIECSEKDSPLLLINLVTAALKARQVKTDNNNFSGYDFVLSVAYDFNSYSTMKAEDMLRKTPKIDLSKPFVDKSNAFNQLFKIDASASVVYG